MYTNNAKPISNLGLCFCPLPLQREVVHLEKPFYQLMVSHSYLISHLPSDLAMKYLPMRDVLPLQ